MVAGYEPTAGLCLGEHPRGGGGGAKRSLCTSNRPSVSGPFDQFHNFMFVLRKFFLSVGGWVSCGWPGPI